MCLPGQKQEKLTPAVCDLIESLDMEAADATRLQFDTSLT